MSSLQKNEQTESGFERGLRYGSPFEKNTSLLETKHSNGSASCGSLFKGSQIELQQDSDLTFEETCLTKLKDQRQKIEELTYLYRSVGEDLKQEEEKNRSLEARMVEFEELQKIKLSFLAVMKDYEAVAGERDSLAQKLLASKRQVSSLSIEKEGLQKALKELGKKGKEELYQQASFYQEVVKDKEDEVTNNLSVFQTKEQEYLDQLHRQDLAMRELEAQAQNQKNQGEAELQRLSGKLAEADQAAVKMKDAIENMKDENKVLRAELRDLSKLFESKESEWMSAQDELVFEIKQTKRKLSDMQALHKETSHKLEKSCEKLKESNEEVTLLKVALQKSEEQSKEQMDTLVHRYDQKISQYQQHTQDLKESISELLEVKQILEKENAEIMNRVSQQEEQRRQRRLLMRSQMRQIEKLENTIRRV